MDVEGVRVTKVTDGCGEGVGGSDEDQNDHCEDEDHPPVSQWFLNKEVGIKSS
jgi:hypothetical protein